MLVKYEQKIEEYSLKHFYFFLIFNFFLNFILFLNLKHCISFAFSRVYNCREG